MYLENCISEYFLYEGNFIQSEKTSRNPKKERSLRELRKVKRVHGNVKKCTGAK